MATRSDRFIATIRTYVPAAVGAFIAWLVTKIPAVADVLTAIDNEIQRAGLVGFTAMGIIQSLALAGVIALYYWLVRVISPKYPWVEKWLLGSANLPVYFRPGDAKTVTEAIPAPVERDAQKTAGASVVVEEDTQPIR